jgi:hypothetical protein
MQQNMVTVSYVNLNMDIVCFRVQGLVYVGWLSFPQWFVYYILHYTKLKLYNYISAPNLNPKCSRGSKSKKGLSSFIS